MDAFPCSVLLTHHVQLEEPMQRIPAATSTVTATASSRTPCTLLAMTYRLFLLTAFSTSTQPLMPSLRSVAQIVIISNFVHKNNTLINFFNYRRCHPLFRWDNISITIFTSYKSMILYFLGSMFCTLSSQIYGAEISSENMLKRALFPSFKVLVFNDPVISLYCSSISILLSIDYCWPHQRRTPQLVRGVLRSYTIIRLWGWEADLIETPWDQSPCCHLRLLWLFLPPTL